MAGKTPKTRPSTRPSEKHSVKEARALKRAADLMTKDGGLSKSAALRGAGITLARDVRRLASKLVPPPAKKSKSSTPPRKSSGQGRAQAAAPLLANQPKKVGTVPKPTATKASSRASYHPKTDLPPLQKAPKAGPAPVPNLVELARPWMMLGFHMATTGLAMQARVARAAMNLTPATAAMRQGSEALNTWLAAVRGQRSKLGKV